MKTTKIAINGFGRIGRNAFKIIFGRPDLEVVAINDLTDISVMAHLLKYDSTYGIYHPVVSNDEKNIIADGKKIPYLSEPKIENIDWSKYDVDVVLECTGRYTKSEDAKKHIDSGASKVIISAPAKDGEVKTIVLGVNDKELADQDVLSNASCTTNCIAPVMSILDEAIGIEKGMMTTVHAYTSTQVVLDGPAKDMRTCRSAAENIIPTTTGASKAVAEVIPNMAGKFGGLSVRVPVPTVSLSDFSMIMKRDTSIEEINNVLKKAASEPYYQGIFEVTNEELVSTDFIGNPASSTVDLNLTNVVGGNLVKVVAWYDNEWGYSNRLVELASEVGKKIKREPKQ